MFRATEPTSTLHRDSATTHTAAVIASSSVTALMDHPITADLNGTSIDHEVDLIAALLDTLNVRCVGILAWSGGGPPAYRFAVRYSDRVSSIVSIAAVSSLWISPKASLMDRLIHGTTLGERFVTFLTEKAPRHVVEEALKGEGSIRGEDLQKAVEQVMAEPEQRQFILEIAPMVM